jgi:hypothetical protein
MNATLPVQRLIDGCHLYMVVMNVEISMSAGMEVSCNGFSAGTLTTFA